MALLHSTLPWIYFTPLDSTLLYHWLYLTLLDSRLLYHGSTITLLESTITLQCLYLTSTWLYIALHMVLRHSTSLKTILPSLNCTLLDSTLFYHCCTSLLLESTLLYHSSTSLYLTVLYCTRALLHSSLTLHLLYRGSTCHSTSTLLQFYHRLDVHSTWPYITLP